ncbi:hypothetical protein [Glaciibacter superstes]|uniref:hypothetical protein n=1 Tax=Glaciibacter superstes TaxID=501023 RepID=UPI0003B6839C|nr:hypothetical protein [Glaciibacter superstes]
MTTQSTAGWRPLQRSSELALVGENPRSLHRAVARQQLVRLRRGVFVDAAEWPEVSERDKYLLRMRAVAATRKVAPVFSHQSAAILWGLPMIGSLPREVHLMAAGRRGVHSKNGVAMEWRAGSGTLRCGRRTFAPCCSKPDCGRNGERRA